MRKLILEDVKELVEIRKTSFDTIWSESDFYSMLSNDNFFGFRSEHGFILCSKVVDVIDIVTFCVIPEFRNKGIGKQLLSEVIKFAEDNSCKIFLEVSEQNHIAQNLYKSLGFEEIAVRKGYYKLSNSAQNAIVMIKQ